MIYKKFKTLFEFQPESKLKAGAGQDKGLYPFYTSSATLVKKIDIAQYKGNSIIFGTGGQPSVHYVSSPFSTSSHCVVAIPKTNEINLRYVYYFFKGNMHILQKGFKGAGLKNISKSYIDKIDIPVISLEQQNKIVWVLSKTEQLINQRKQSIEILEKLVKSVFLEMFGDPYLNTKSWGLVRISSVINSIISGWSANGEQRQKKGDELGVLKVSAVTAGFFRPDEHKAINKSQIDRPLVHPLKNDILYSRANTRELVGAICIVDDDYEDLFLPDKLWKINLDLNKVQPYYFKYVLNNPGFRKSMARRATGTSGSMVNISQSKFQNHLFPNPPILLQQKFNHIADFISQREKQLKYSLETLETLFRSLLQQAFRGEFFLNKSEYSIQKAITELNWLEEQFQTLESYGFSSETIKMLAETRDNEGIETTEDLNQALKAKQLPSIEEIADFKEVLYALGITFLNEVESQSQIQQLISHPVLQHTQVGQVFGNLLEQRRLENVKQEIVRESSPVLNYMTGTLFRDRAFGDEQVNLARFIHESFGGKEFALSDLMEYLSAEQMVKGKKAVEIKNQVFAIVQEFIKTEFPELPFTFQDLYRRLREKLFCPAFDLLHEFIVTELDQTFGLRQMYYPGEMEKEFPQHFRRLQNEKASNKLYLIATYGNSQN